MAAAARRAAGGGAFDLAGPRRRGRAAGRHARRWTGVVASAVIALGGAVGPADAAELGKALRAAWPANVTRLEVASSSDDLEAAELAEAMSAAAAVAAVGAGISGYVCQVYLPVGKSLQEVLGVTCTVKAIAPTLCVCNDRFWHGWDPYWRVVPDEQKPAMRHDAKPGEWFLLDATRTCSVSMRDDGRPIKAPCPPGFYCAGGLEPPRSCDEGDSCPGGTPPDNRECLEGYFCPFPSAERQKCPSGAMCPPGSTQPEACAAGLYCKDGQAQVCPQGYYCPVACVQPIKCSRIMLCPEGSTHENSLVIAVSFLFVCGTLMAVGAGYYKNFVQSGARTMGVLAVVIIGLYAIDKTIGGFLMLNFGCIGANYIVLRVGTVPPGWEVARLLMISTLLAGLTVLWLINPAWSMLCAGILYCFAVGWTVTRESKAIIKVGQALIVLTCLALCVFFWREDRELLQCVGVGVLVYTCYLVLSYSLIEAERPGNFLRRSDVPFESRWTQRGGEGVLSAPSAPDVVAAVVAAAAHEPELGTAGGCPEARPPAQAALPLHSRASFERHSPVTFSPRGRAPLREPAPPVSVCPAPTTCDREQSRGVSFVLNDVGFALIEGDQKQLLSNITCYIPPGERVAVMGPSGSGKSTLLAVLSGQASYGKVSGQLTVGGQQLRNGLDCLRHVTGYVPQDDILHGELTVLENISYQAKLRLPGDMTDADVEREVTCVCRDLNLVQIRDSRVGTVEKRGISGGQRKRVSIAMELVTQPLLLFADEPTSGLDSTTAHEVVDCLNRAAQRLGTTVVAVIHQPRFETLLLFEMVTLLATGGTLVYAGSPKDAVGDFRRYLEVDFPANANPADVMLDKIQNLRALPDAGLMDLTKAFVDRIPLEGQFADQNPEAFRRNIPSFVRALLFFLDRAMLQTMRARSVVIINQVLCITVMLMLCGILKNQRIDQFMMQSCLSTLFLMLLQGVAAQRIFGTDLLITVREARAGMPMIAYLVARDLAAMFEITLSAAVFASAYGPASGTQQPVLGMFAGAWAFVYSVYGLSYISSICLSPGAAQMTAVVAAFVSFCVSGVYQPQLPEMASYFGGRGWMIPALSSVRWFWGFLLTAEMRSLTELSKRYGESQLRDRGYDLQYLEGCSTEGIDWGGSGVITLESLWLARRGWVCSAVDMLLLGIMFRFLAGACLILYLYAKTSRWAQFFSDSRGRRKLWGRILMLLIGAFMLLFLLAEVWIFGIQRIDFKRLIAYLGFGSSS